VHPVHYALDQKMNDTFFDAHDEPYHQCSVDKDIIDTAIKDFEHVFVRKAVISSTSCDRTHPVTVPVYMTCSV